MTEKTKIHRRASPHVTFTDSDGRRVVRATATKGLAFEIWAEDWERVCRDVTPTWRTIGDGRGNYYIAGHRPDRRTPVTLARVVIGAGRGQKVKYDDGNPLNLRRDNLALVSGFGKHEAPQHGAKAA